MSPVEWQDFPLLNETRTYPDISQAQSKLFVGGTVPTNFGRSRMIKVFRGCATRKAIAWNRNREIKEEIFQRTRRMITKIKKEKTKQLKKVLAWVYPRL